MSCARCGRAGAVPEGEPSCGQCAAAPSGTPRELPSAPPVSPVPPAKGVAPVAWLRSPVGLGRATAALLGLVLVVDLFAVGVELYVHGVLDDIVNGGGGADLARRADRADSLFETSGVLQSGALLAAAVVFLCWFYRVRVNAEVFDPFGHTMKRGWAIGAWFVPLVNLWFPRRITVEVWKASGDPERPRGHGLVNAWWVMWVVSISVSRVASRMYGRAEEAEVGRTAVRLLLFADLTDALAAVLAVLLVLRLTRMQHEKALRGPVAGGIMQAPALG